VTRFKRKNRTDIEFKGCGGITDALDDMLKDLWRINDEELDYLIENLSDDELNIILPAFKDISQIKSAIKIVNDKLEEYETPNNTL